MKISALTAATTPLSGAELFPIVQSGNTRRVSLNDLLRSIGNGTAAAPALAPGGDPNTGIYFPAADTLAFVTGGTEDWRINSGGHFLAATDNTFDVGASGANRPRDIHIGRNLVLNSGSLISIPDNFFLFDSSSAITRFGFSTNNTYNTRSAGNHIFQVDGVEAARINSARDLIVGGSTGAAGVSIVPDKNLTFGEGSGTSYVNLFRQSSSAGAVLANGYKYTNTANGFASSVSAAWAKSAIRLAAGGIQFYADSATTVANGTDTTATERMRLDASGNLGLGVTPAAWSVRAFELGGTPALSTVTGTDLTYNAFFDGAWKYRGTAVAMRYSQVAGGGSPGSHQWFTAPSGTAGATISFTQAMTLHENGNLAVGLTASTIRLNVGTNNPGNGIVARIENTAGSAWTGAQIQFTQNSLADWAIGQVAGANEFGIWAGRNATGAGTLLWRIPSSGHLLAGTDATYDIGASGATRPRDLFLGRNMVGGGWVRAGAASAGAASTTTIGSTTATTVGAAGAASALPANPLGYIVAHVGTTEVRIPYYNA